MSGDILLCSNRWLIHISTCIELARAQSHGHITVKEAGKYSLSASLGEKRNRLADMCLLLHGTSGIPLPLGRDKSQVL